MPRTKEKFQQIRDVTKQKILDKAAEVFAEKGLADTKVSDLARAAGVSQGLLYWYFTDKDHVFISLLERTVTGVTGYIQNAARQTGTPLKKIRWLTDQILLGMSENPAYFKLISQGLALSGKMQDIARKFESIGKMLRDFIVEGQNAGEIVKRSPDQLVFLYLCCMYGLAAGRSFKDMVRDETFPDADAILKILKP